jgi:hypothetical protein
MSKYSMKVKGKEIGPVPNSMLPLTLWMDTPTNVTNYTKTETGPEEINKVNMGVGFYSKGAATPQSILTGLVTCVDTVLPLRAVRSAEKWVNNYYELQHSSLIRSRDTLRTISQVEPVCVQHSGWGTDTIFTSKEQIDTFIQQAEAKNIQLGSVS